ncbi:hypothetical protein B4135_2775 [Caldibacillus debilis]|uniref:Uncharacterized protein n=1 Tax=Caldibacillus debilis TaxID=301148 RepID=A0A150LPZ4_9BACI|nr:hypothetical protein B4135_2775 [Caldibacillus debilis]
MVKDCPAEIRRVFHIGRVEAAGSGSLLVLHFLCIMEWEAGTR